MEIRDISVIHSNIEATLRDVVSTSKEDLFTKCCSLVESFSKLGPYTTTTWHHTQVKVWEDLIQKIGESPYKEESLSYIMHAKGNQESEALEFLEHELRHTIQPDPERASEQLKSLTNRFPNNGLFRKYRCNFIDYESDCTTEDIMQLYNHCYHYEVSYSDGAKNTPNHLATNGIKCFYLLTERFEFEKAFQVRQSLMEQPNVMSDTHLKNIVINLKYVLIQSKATYKQNQQSIHDVKEEIKKVTYESNKKSFEQLIIFTAIITFVVTAAGSSVQSSLPLWEIVGLGMTLLVFVLAIMMCLDKPQVLLKDFRFYILIAAFGLTGALAITSAMNKVTIINNNYRTEMTGDTGIIYPVSKLAAAVNN